MPWPPNILHYFHMLDGVLQNRVLWIKVLMVHSNDYVFCESTTTLGIVDEHLVVPWSQESCVDEIVTVFNILVEVRRVHSVNISELVVVALVVNNMLPSSKLLINH